MDNKDLYDSLVSLVGETNVLRDEPMRLHTTFKIGGNADWFVTPASVDAIADVVSFLKKSDINYYIIGNGSNILVSDDGFRGVIVCLGDNFNTFEINIQNNKCVVKAQAGVKLSKLGNELARQGVSGFEFATGIPGCIGGAVRMNAGAYGGEFKDILVSVNVLDGFGEIKTIKACDLELGYRTSIIEKKELIVLDATFELGIDDSESIMGRISELALKRRQKQPLEFPSAGSTFKRPEGSFAGKLIEDAGLKGFTVGGIQVSEKHAGFVINKGNGTAKDFCELTDEVARIVNDKYNVSLELEVVKVGFEEK